MGVIETMFWMGLISSHFLNQRIEWGKCGFVAKNKMSSQLPKVHLNGVAEAKIKGVGDKGMADGHFEQPRHVFLVKTQVFEVQIVPGVDADADIVRKYSALAVRLYRFFLVF